MSSQLEENTSSIPRPEFPHPEASLEDRTLNSLNTSQEKTEVK